MGEPPALLRRVTQPEEMPLVHFLFGNGTKADLKSVPSENSDPMVSLTCGSNSTTTLIKQKPLYKGSKILGVWLAPNGNFAKHLKVTKKKADTFSVRIRSSRLTPNYIRTFHKT
jgi:hypothetical protein